MRPGEKERHKVEDGEYLASQPPASRREEPELTAREYRHALRARHARFDWLASFLGFTVAMFFLVVLLGVVGAIAGTVGFQLQAAAPGAGGGPVSDPVQRIGLGVLFASWLAALIAYFVGGYAAGRVARYGGVRNGAGIVLWTVLVALVLGILGAIFGSRFNVTDQLHLGVSPSSLTLPGVVSLVVTLLIMFGGSALGGLLGSLYHRRVDRDVAASATLR
jgi:hypothetical protein